MMTCRRCNGAGGLKIRLAHGQDPREVAASDMEWVEYPPVRCPICKGHGWEPDKRYAVIPGRYVIREELKDDREGSSYRPTGRTTSELQDAPNPYLGADDTG